MLSEVVRVTRTFEFDVQNGDKIRISESDDRKTVTLELLTDHGNYMTAVDLDVRQWETLCALRERVTVTQPVNLDLLNPFLDFPFFKESK